MPSPGPEVGVLHHVARVLLVAGEATRERERVDEGAPHQLVERLPVAASAAPISSASSNRILLLGYGASTRRTPERLRARTGAADRGDARPG